jgi:signal transduction histidine kinase
VLGLRLGADDYIVKPLGSIFLRGSLKEGAIVIDVEDQGKGIAKEELERITEPFYRVDKPRSRKDGWTGLGLALCQRIAEVHGARLEFSSELGKGTNARFLVSGRGIGSGYDES